LFSERKKTTNFRPRGVSNETRRRGRKFVREIFMNELQTGGTLLLLIGGWALLTYVFRDIFLTARLCLLEAGASVPARRLKISGVWLTNALASACGRGARGAILLKRFSLLVPALQMFVWKIILIVGFAFFYLAIFRHTRGAATGGEFLDEFYAAGELSFAVWFRIPFESVKLEEPVNYLVAGAQFYLVFAFYAFVCFYFWRLREISRRVEPRLYNPSFADGFFDAPLAAADELRRFYGADNLRAILRDWESWAKEVETLLTAHPHFIYGGARRDWRRSWLAGLNFVLDVSAALIVTSDGALEKRARKTFAAARVALLAVCETLPASDSTARAAQAEEKNGGAAGENADDETLAAELISEIAEPTTKAKQTAMFRVWQFTYQSKLRNLADYLGAEIAA
jgi:hypothetical protein